MINEQANVKVTLNSQQAQRELEELQGEMKRLIALKKKAEEKGDVEGYKQIDRELKKVNRQANKLVRENRDIETTLKNLNGASINDLRKAQRALTAQTNKLNRETKEYTEKRKQLKLVKNQIRSINAEYRSQQSLMSRVSGAFNKYFGIITAGAASFAGLFLGMRKAINEFSEFDDKLADVMKTTGLTKDRVKALNEELEKIDTRTSQEELLNLARVAGKLGITAEEEILGFVRAADQISVALGEDLGGAEDAVRELGKLTDIFKITELYGQEQALLKVGSAINELGMASTANEGYLVEFSKRTAGIAPQAGVSAQNIFGLAATLDSLGQKAEMSSTAYSKLMTTMTKKTAEFAKIAGMSLQDFSRLMEEDANEAMIRVFEGINKNEGGFQQLVVTLGDLGVEGQRMTSVFGALANNTGLLREQQALANDAFSEGTSLTDEFNIKNNTAQANLEKARKNFAEMRRELGERLIPAYTSVISKSKLLLQFISALIDVVEIHGKKLLVAASAIAGYTIAINAHNIATKAYNAITTAATAITKGFNTAVKANPVGLLVGLLTSAATAYFLFRNRTKEAKEEQDNFNKVVEEGNDLLLQTKTLEERASIVKNLSKEQLETLRSDLAQQVKNEENFHATLLQKLKKRLDDDEQLKKLYARRNQDGLTRMQQINLDAQINARKQALAREVEDQNKANQQRLKNLKTHLAKVNTELKNRPDESGSGAGNTDYEAAKQALELANKQRILMLQEQYGQEENMQKLLHARLLANELAYLQAKARLETDESKKIDLQLQILDVQQKYNEALKQAIEPLRLKKQAVDEVNEKLLEEEKLMAKVAANAAKATKDQEQLNDTLSAQAKTYQDTITVVSDGLYEMMQGGEDAFKEFGKKILIFALEQLKVQAQLAAAGATVQSLAQPDSIATFGASGLARAAIIVGLIEAAFAGLEGLVAGAFSGSEGKKSGGYTSPATNDDEVVDYVHSNEFVANANAVRNPSVRYVLDIIDLAQKSGAISTLNLPAVIGSGGKKTGGYSSQPTAEPGVNLTQPYTNLGTDPAVLDRLDQMINRIEKLNVSVAIDRFEKERNKYLKIQQTSGL